ncbi:ubiquitin carboxyl-terminal hydrolase 28 isoform X1 [Brachionus plicatilis]|uniref:ubiquitinyl hydrolase 1 n=1 Tax=Brachionus plicatilis TaxID=10195 RepID=A0A3M7PZQ8_BRAPC|nr:ubiquitin carboxyl-terminal hydrolase 28 isoform X1 [Brachionus plicatilis]
MTLDTSTSANKSSPQSINVIKKSRNEVIKTIQEIAKVDEATINQAIEACQDNEGRYSMDTVLNILMDEKYSFEQKNRDNKSDGAKFSRQYGVSPTSNDEKFSSKKNYQSNTINDSSFGPGNNLEEEDDEDYEQIANSDSRGHQKLKCLESELIREDGRPCGLRNVGNTCWFNSIIQSLFHLPGFREIILSFRLSESEIVKLDDREKNMVLFVAELRKLFAQMLKSKRRVINPNPTLKCLKNCSKFDSDMSNQEDVSEFMTILVNIIEESFEIWSNLKQSQPEQKPVNESENLVSKLNEQLNIKPLTDFRSEHKNVGLKKSKNNPIVNLLDGEIIVKRKDSDVNSESSITDIFREVNIQMLNSRNLHAGLELEWGETLIDKQISGEAGVSSNSGKNEPSVNRSIYQQESWVKKLPRVLFICLNRYKFVQATQSSSKILEPFEFYQKIYLDRYLDENKEIIIKKRKEVKVLREELKNLEDKLNRYLFKERIAFHY